MDPFELTKDPDGGGMTVCVKHGFVVLTREEERRVTERLAGLMDENAKLRELVRDVWEWELHGCDACNLIETAKCDTDIYSEDCLMRVALSDRMRELGIEAE